MAPSHRLLAVLLFAALPSLTQAAPPTLTRLFPAGAGRGKTATVTVTGVLGRWPVRAWIEGKGVEIQPSKERGQFTVTVAPDALPGPRQFRLYNDEGPSAPRTFVIGTLPEVEEKEPNDDFRKPHVLDTDRVVVNGRLQKPGDVDCFAVKLRKGQTLIASMEAARLGSPMDGVLQVLSADGFVLEQNDDHHGPDPQIAFAVPRDGTYIVRTYAFPAVPDASVRFAGAETFIYRLTITAGGFAEHAFPLAVEREKPGGVELVGWNIPAGAKKVNLIADEEGNEGIAYHPDVAGVGRVRLEPNPTLIRMRGQMPQDVTLPVTATGRIEESDAVHVYRFEAKKGQRLPVALESRSLGFALDASLKVTNESGKVLAQAQSRALEADPALTFNVPADGKYRLEVRDLTATAGPLHVYRLRVGLPPPDFSLSVASDRFMLTAGKAVEIPITVGRENGFAEEILVSVLGLPEGVEASISGPATVKTKTVTVRLTGKGAASGSFRIVGTVKGKNVRRLARASVTGQGRTQHLWLIVTGGKDGKRE